jgi:hypothetical protein
VTAPPIRCRCCLAELPDGAPEPAYCGACRAPGSDEVDAAYRDHINGVLLGEIDPATGNQRGYEP